MKLTKREVDIMKIGIIIPSDCPDEKLVKFAGELVQREDTMVVVVDDGCEEDIVYTRIFQMLEERGTTYCITSIDWAEAWQSRRACATP